MGDVRWPRAWRLAVIALPALVRLLYFDVDRFHGDDLLTASFSSAYGLGGLFAPVPPNWHEWVAQYPAPFFLLQKLFFLAFGESFLTIKLSILPYVLLVSYFLFRIAEELLDERAAAITLVVYAFFGPSLYLETLGLMFVSSSALFLGFLWFAIRERQSGNPRDAIVAGLFAGACCLVYQSSILAPPFGAVCFLAGGAAARERRTFRNAFLFFATTAAVVAPFFIGAIDHGNYVLRRFDQIALLGGEWSSFSHDSIISKNAPTIVRASGWTAFRSVYTEGIGGHGGYDFGHQALLEPVVAVLVALGILLAIRRGWSRRDWWIILLVIGVAFFTGVVMTIPPPAFHRMSLAFPLIALVAALPLHAILEARRGGVAFRRTLALVLLAAITVNGHLYLRRAALPETLPSPLRLAHFIDELYPGRPLYVAAFPSYAFEKIYRFVPDRRATRVETAYHKDMLPKLDPSERYVYIVTLPQYFDADFRARDPHGRLIHFSPEFSVFVN